MATVQEVIQEQLEAQKAQYLAQIADAKAKAEADLAAQKSAAQKSLDDQKSQAQSSLYSQHEELQNDILSQQTSLDTQFKGFLTGIIAPAYRGTDSGVLVRDPLRNAAQPSAQSAGSPEKKSFIPFILMGGLAYYYFYKKRRA